MHNMSDQFYEYLSEKILEFFSKNNPIKGDRFYINFDEEEQVKSLYYSLKNVAGNIVSPFNYTNDISKDSYDTYSFDINGIKFVVAENFRVNIDFLVKLRNLVPTQKNEWENTVMIIICHDANDSITDGSRDLEKEGMPFNVKYISANIEEEIANSPKLEIVDKCITKFALKNQEEEIFQITLWDYEVILSILRKGRIDDEDLKELNLFRDDDLESYISSDNIEEAYLEAKGRLAENFDTFVEVKNISQYDNKEEKLDKKFTDTVVKKLKNEDWYKVEWNKIKASKIKREIELSDPLEYKGIKSIDNDLVYWDRPSSTSKSGLRKRHIIVFNDKNCNNVSLEFEFDREISKNYLHKSIRDIAKKSKKNCFKVSFNVESTKPTFKSIIYKHHFNYDKKDNKEDGPVTDFTFNIFVINSSQEIFKSIKSRYSLKKDFIIVTNDEDSDDITFGIGKERIEEIENNGDEVYLYDENKIIISEQSPAWGDTELRFNLIYNNNIIPFLIKEEKERTIPKPSSFIWNLKRKNKDNIIYNGVKAIQGTSSFYLEEKFKNFLNLEKQIIENNIFYAKEIDHSIKKINLSFNEDLEKAYLAILEHFRDYDDSPEDNLPSLFYLDDELKELYGNFIYLFNKEVSEIQEGNSLSNLETKKDLLKIGRIDTENRIMYSPLSPINIAYQLELSNQCGNEDLSTNIVERLVPNNLIPFLYSDNDELYKPIFQDYAQEWTIFEKESKVSIGTTNAFISNLVSEKLTQFVKHFSYLFDVNTSSPIKINLINIADDIEVVKGIFAFVRSRLPDK